MEETHKPASDCGAKELALKLQLAQDEQENLQYARVVKKMKFTVAEKLKYIEARETLRQREEAQLKEQKRMADEEKMKLAKEKLV